VAPTMDPLITACCFARIGPAVTLARADAARWRHHREARIKLRRISGVCTAAAETLSSFGIEDDQPPAHTSARR